MIIQIDIARLLITNALEHLKLAEKFHKKHISHPIDEAEECIQAIILFQSAMEAVITEEIENEKRLKVVLDENNVLARKHHSLSFKNKWLRAFDVLSIKQRKSLDAYFVFYSEYRLPISHPKGRYLSLEKYQFKETIMGIKNGWEAIEFLYKSLKKTYQSFDDYWKKV